MKVQSLVALGSFSPWAFVAYLTGAFLRLRNDSLAHILYTEHASLRICCLLHSQATFLFMHFLFQTVATGRSLSWHVVNWFLMYIMSLTTRGLSSLICLLVDRNTRVCRAFLTFIQTPGRLSDFSSLETITWHDYRRSPLQVAFLDAWCRGITICNTNTQNNCVPGSN